MDVIVDNYLKGVNYNLSTGRRTVVKYVIPNYFWYAFFSSLRSSELIALQWPKVDFHSSDVRVDAAQVLSRVKKTKTEKARDVEMNAESRAALLAQKKHTYLANEHVFLNPNTGKPYFNHQAPWLALRACLKALGIRHRPAYNTRHTYATMLLMAGSNPYWVSKQLGHASLELTLKVYATWIKNADDGRVAGHVLASRRGVGHAGVDICRTPAAGDQRAVRVQVERHARASKARQEPVHTLHRLGGRCLTSPTRIRLTSSRAV